MSETMFLYLLIITLNIFLNNFQLFRHGDRTPRKDELYPKLPYNASIYNSTGLGELTEVTYYF